jgi:hypothetical protein
MVDMNYWLGVKYGILSQNAASDALRARSASAQVANEGRLQAAQAQHYATQSALAPSLARATIEETGARAGQYGAESELLRSNVPQPSPVGLSRAYDLMSGAGGQTQGQTPSYIGQNYFNPQNSVLNAPTTSHFNTPYQRDYNFGDSSVRVHYARGEQDVPGEGDGSLDTVPAMLAPGEAVLNKGAAEHVGRGLIAQLNDLGAAKMAAAGAPPQGMAKGHGMPKGKSGGKGKSKQKHASGTPMVKKYNMGTDMISDDMMMRPDMMQYGMMMRPDMMRDYAMGTEEVFPMGGASNTVLDKKAMTRLPQGTTKEAEAELKGAATETKTKNKR